jgi:hypothetical protein
VRVAKDSGIVEQGIECLGCKNCCRSIQLATIWAANYIALIDCSGVSRTMGLSASPRALALSKEAKHDCLGVRLSEPPSTYLCKKLPARGRVSGILPLSSLLKVHVHTKSLSMKHKRDNRRPRKTQRDNASISKFTRKQDEHALDHISSIHTLRNDRAHPDHLQILYTGYSHSVC